MTDTASTHFSVLRPGHRGLLTADVFENGLVSALEGRVRLVQPEMGAWLDAVWEEGAHGTVGPTAAARLAVLLEGFRFLSFPQALMPFAPALATMRNQAGCPTRLLIFAHASGASAWDWAVLTAVLQPGDRIIAPTGHAAAVLVGLSGRLRPYVSVIPHAIPALGPDVLRAPTRRLISLSRLRPSKLHHRVIDALGWLKKHGHPVPSVDIAAPIDPSVASYAQTLLARAQRHGIAKQVRLVGRVAPDERAAWLEGAAASISLSATLEESFGKAVVEAMSVGLPVISNRWNGLPETLGEGGVLIETVHSPDGADVDPASLARAMLAICSEPPPVEQCLKEASRSHPNQVGSAYVRVMQEGWMQHAQHTAPPPSWSGLLDQAAPLNVLSPSRVASLRLSGFSVEGRKEAVDELRSVLLEGLTPVLSQWFSTPPEDWTRPDYGQAAPVPSGATLTELLCAAASRSGLPQTRRACLFHLRTEPESFRRAWQAAEMILPTQHPIRLISPDPAERASAAEALSAQSGASTLALALESPLGEPQEAVFRAVFAHLRQEPDGPDAASLWLAAAWLAADLGHGDEAWAALERAEALSASEEACAALGQRLLVAMLGET